MVAVRIVVVRHGQTDWNLEKIIQGQADTSLTELGIAQAAQTGRWLAENGYSRFGHVVSSDLKRAHHTALQILSSGAANVAPDSSPDEAVLTSAAEAKVAATPEAPTAATAPVKLDPRLRERHMGRLQGLSMAQTGNELHTLFQDKDYRVPGVPGVPGAPGVPDGESREDVHKRVSAALDDTILLAARHPEGLSTALLVTHGGAAIAAYRHASSLSIDADIKVSTGNCSIGIISAEVAKDDTICNMSVESWNQLHHLQTATASNVL